MSTQTLLPIPPHFDPSNAKVWGYTPDQNALVDVAYDWAEKYGIKAAAVDDIIIQLLIIDGQFDFTNPQGTLYVAGRSGNGALDDCIRTAELIYRNLRYITRITPTFDTHFAFQIFFRTFWIDTRTGRHPAVHTVILADEVEKGIYVPDPAMVQFVPGRDYVWLCNYVLHYCRQLEATGKYALYIWPFHTQLGSVGHALNGVIEEAVKFHALVRSVQTAGEIKGTNPFTENYSVLAPEVMVAHDGRTIGSKNVRFIDTLLAADHVIIVGQAASHCVKNTIDNLLGEIAAKDPALAKKVYVVRDCMSSVTVPDGKGGFVADFTNEAEKAIQKFADAGMHVVESTTPMEEWPDIKLAA